MLPCLGTDLDAVFSSNDFGEDDGSVYWNGRPIKGAHFDDEDVEIEPSEGMAEIAHQTMLTAPAAQFDGIADDDTIEARGREYTVKFWKDDGTGVIEIYLEAG